MRYIRFAIFFLTSFIFAGSLAAQGLTGAYLAATRANINGDFRAAALYYERALKSDPENLFLRQNALVSYVSSGDFDNAIRTARAFDAKVSMFADLLLMADETKAGNYEVAQSYVPQDGSQISLLLKGLVSAWLSVGAGDTETAYAEFDRLNSNKSVEAYGQYHKAMALAFAGDFAQAIALFEADEEPLHLNRLSVLAHAQILSELGQTQQAIDVIDAASINGFSSQALTEMRMELVNGEVPSFNVIEDPSEGIAQALETIAEALSREDPNRIALYYARLAEHIRPESLEAKMLSADILERLGQYQLAGEIYRTVPEGSEYYKLAVIRLSETERQQGNIDSAAEGLRALAEAYPDEADIWSALGDLHRGVEEFEEARIAYTEAINTLGTVRAQHWGVFFTRGITNERTGRWDEAEADFRRALELSPDQPSVLNYLGYSYVEMGINIDEAKEMIEKAVNQRPEDGYIRDSLAWVLYRLGEYEAALPHMVRAAQQLPVDPIINDHLGDVLWKVGREYEARFQWRRALSFDPEEADLERIKRKLEVGLDVVLEEEQAK